MSSRSVDSQPPEAAWSDVERELLGAARAERMPAELEARLRDALAFAPGIAEVPTSASASVETAPRASFNDTARARQLFAGKLPLWGMLGIVAIGAFSYYALTRGLPQPTAAATRQQVTAPAQGSATHEAVQLDVSASAHEVTAHGAADAQREATVQGAASVPRNVGPASASAQAGSMREAASAQRGGVGSTSASAQAGSRREAASAERDDVGGDVARAPRHGLGDAECEAASAERDGVGSACASAQVGSRREAVSAQRDSSVRVTARARDGRRQQTSSARPRAVSTDTPVVPPMAADNGTAQAAGPQHEPNVVSAHVVQSGKAATPDQLRLEAQLLESARSALGHGALPEARQWLARYQAQFARGALQPESQVLGIELAVRTGARTAAKAQAEHFLAQHPHHPLRDRVQILTEEPH